MTRYAQLSRAAAGVTPTSRAVVQAIFDSASPASAFPDVKDLLVVAGVQVQSGWLYDGSAFFAVSTSLPDLKAARQADLDGLLDANFDFKAFIRAGTATSVTAANVGTFLAQICNNYRTLRAAIASAADAGALAAINLNSGWPANP